VIVEPSEHLAEAKLESRKKKSSVAFILFLQYNLLIACNL
jgi:hypothetical protein